ncbi:OmpA family protein [Moheibacter lacus]|uniref:OmpA family protein n=1 Tax=Moheibacter lacus TaxID=2745851 RepID=A0A838ZTA0_9FLAO|nr:OmpA family protein [Moheibacter lacus]MBA5630206.1 OmpA family protein [Moheibacter lacus]
MNRILTILIFLFSFIVNSQEKTIPQLYSDNGNLNLQSQSLEVNVVGTVADVRLYQTFKVSETKLVAYLFPIGLETSLYELMVYLPDKIYSLDAQNMDNIRKQVLAENKKRKRITLMHGSDPQFIKLNIPISEELEEVKVVLKYAQNLEKSADEKSLQLPSFIAPQYENHLEEFSFGINIISPTPIYDLVMTSLDLEPKKVSQKYQTFQYSGKDWGKPIELVYKSRGDEAEAGMLVYEDKGCRYILGVVEPPKIIKPEEIAPREYVFLMDTSGSMQGFPIETSKELVTRILNDLKPEEKFNILFFAGGSDFLSAESVYATEENKSIAINAINQQKGTGKTQLSEALHKVYAYKPEKEFNRIVVLITDGKLLEDRTLYLNLKNNLKEAQYFTFGIGYDVDRRTIQQLANTMGTEPVLITEQPEAEAELNRFFNLIRTPLLRNIQVQSRELNLQETYPNQFKGFLSSESSSFVSKECSGMREPKLILTGIDGEETYQEEFRLPQEKNNDELFILKYLWAREKIDFLLQEEERCGERCIKDGKYRNQIIKIGEELNIATPFTSFIEENYINFNGNLGRKTSLYENPNAKLTFQNDFDSDFDRIPNTTDQCPFDRGTTERKGCPKTKEEKIALEISRQLEGIEFEFDSYVIQPEFYEKLNVAAEIINHQQLKNYIVEGHTDAAGTPEYNQALSINRAKAVVNYLKGKGVDIRQLKIVGKGDKELRHPECRPHTVCGDDKNFENRRVVFKIID